MSDHPVLIVGAGPTGLVLAIELARRGVPFHLVDRRPEPLGWDRAAVVKSRSLEIFESMGLAETFVRRGRIVRGVNVFSDGAKVAYFDFVGLDTRYPFNLSIPEDETERILTEKLEALGGRVERGIEFVGLDEGQGSVRAQLRSLHDGERAVEASWVVGTDGLHSNVRAAIGDEFDGQDSPSLWGVVDAHLSTWRHPGDWVAAQLEPPGLIPIPLRDGRWRIYFRPEDRDGDALAKIGESLAVISPGVILQDPDEPQFFHTHARVARRFRTGRVLLAGDAAHVCSPIEGHGMNTGIQDAYNLGWKLALVVTGAAPQALLDSYDLERRPIAQAISRSGQEAEARSARRDSPAIGELISFLATAEGRRLAAVGESEIALAYDESPIVDDAVPASRSMASGTKVGFRVGDIVGLEGRDRTFRLHELIGGPSHILFLMVGDAEPDMIEDGFSLAKTVLESYQPHVQAYVVTRNAAPVERSPSELLRDPTGALHERLGADPPSLCLVRPDGHLGFRGESPSREALRAHLERIFVTD